MKSFLKKYYASLGRFRALYLLSAIELLVMVSWSVYSGDGISMANDAPSYYQAFDIIISGKPDVARTPLFPLIIGSLSVIFGSIVSAVLVYLLQGLLFLFSINWLGTILDNITYFKKISYWFTAIYALYPGVVSLCGVMMTESLTISLVTVVLYLVYGICHGNSCKKGVLLGVICVLLWMLRPSLIIIPFLLSIFWVVYLILNRIKIKAAVYALFTTVISIMVMGLYSLSFMREYHVFGMTSISTVNNYLTLREADIVNFDEICSQQLNLPIDSMLKINGSDRCEPFTRWEEIAFLYDRFGFEWFYNFVNYKIKNNPEKVFSYLYQQRLDNLLNDRCVFTGNAMPPKVDSVTRVVRIDNGTAFLIFFIGLFLLVYSDIKRKKVNYFEWLLFALFAANYFTVWIGAPGEFGRLLAQNYPILIAISCWVLDRLCLLAISSNNTIRISFSSDTPQS